MILDEIAVKTRLRVERAKLLVPFEQVREQAFSLAVSPLLPEKGMRTGEHVVEPISHSPLPTPHSPLPFEQALSHPGLSFICEVKKASPSKGIIAADFPWMDIALEYESAGAAAISVLTEPEYFLGSDQYLREIAAAVRIPTLRKDFIIDPYQIYEAKILGAQAVLLICALLNGETLASYLNIATELGLSSLVETHNEAEVDMAVSAGARIIGINNRDLATFKVDTGLSSQLRSRIPAGIITVAESGIKSAEDIRALRNKEFPTPHSPLPTPCIGFDAVLIGESLMRSADKKRFLQELRVAYGENIG